MLRRADSQAISVREWTSSFYRMWETWVATVRRDSSSLAAISGFDNPSSTKAAIFISVAVRLSQPLRACRCLACGPRRIRWARNVAWRRGDVRGRAQRGVGLHGLGERGPCLAAVADADELFSGRLQRLRAQQRPAGVVITLRGCEEPGGIVVKQAAAIERVRLRPCRRRRDRCPADHAALGCDGRVYGVLRVTNGFGEICVTGALVRPRHRGGLTPDDRASKPHGAAAPARR